MIPKDGDKFRCKIDGKEAEGIIVFCLIVLNFIYLFLGESKLDKKHSSRYNISKYDRNTKNLQTAP